MTDVCHLELPFCTISPCTVTSTKDTALQSDFIISSLCFNTFTIYTRSAHRHQQTGITTVLQAPFKRWRINKIRIKRKWAWTHLSTARTPFNKIYWVLIYPLYQYAIINRCMTAWLSLIRTCLVLFLNTPLFQTCTAFIFHVTLKNTLLSFMKSHLTHALFQVSWCQRLRLCPQFFLFWLNPCVNVIKHNNTFFFFTRPDKWNLEEVRNSFDLEETAIPALAWDGSFRRDKWSRLVMQEFPSLNYFVSAALFFTLIFLCLLYTPH